MTIANMGLPAHTDKTSGSGSQQDQVDMQRTFARSRTRSLDQACHPDTVVCGLGRDSHGMPSGRSSSARCVRGCVRTAAVYSWPVYALVFQIILSVLHDVQWSSGALVAQGLNSQTVYLEDGWRSLASGDQPSWSTGDNIAGHRHRTLVVPSADEVQIFQGSQETTGGDSFRELLLDGDYLLLGSKNALYQLYVGTEQLSVTRTIVWPPKSSDIDRCHRLTKDQEDCHNYIRVISKKSDSELLLCGTMAYSRGCQTFRETESGYDVVSTESGKAKCSFDKRQNSTAVYSDGRLYSGTVADLASRDALIYREPIRTEQYDSQWLNDPNFVSSFAFEDKVYFFFRETAVEFINCGKSIYSRVARVCKNDAGGSGGILKSTIWTSFFKSRLNCSIPGDFPFFFDEIQSTSELGQGHYRSTLTVDETHQMVYAVFTTPSNSMPGSAVCAFKMEDIVKTFEGPFKGQKSAHSNWMPVKEADVPVPHPAKECHNDSKSIPNNVLMFIKNHPLMDQAVPAFGGQPLLVQSSFSYKMTQITVDWQYRAVDGRRYDILYVGTDDGRVIKAVNKDRSDQISTTVIEDIAVFPERYPIQKLQLYRSSRSPRVEHLVVVSEREVRTLPLHRCHTHKTCSDCVALQDPYCSWDVDRGLCINLMDPQELATRYFYQNVETGKHSQCSEQPNQSTLSSSSLATTSTDNQHHQSVTPTAGVLIERTISDTNSVDTLPRASDVKDASHSVGPSSKCAGEKIAIAVLVPTVAFSLLGFFVGVFVTRRCFLREHGRPNNHLSEAVTTKYSKGTENTYSQDPANKYVTKPPFPQGSKVRLLHNPTKQCNLSRAANGSVEAIVEPHKEKQVYV